MNRYFGQSLQLVLRIVGLASSVLVVLVLARYLGPAQYGTLAAGFTMASILYSISDSGTFPLGVAELTRTASTFRRGRQIIWARLAILFLALPVSVLIGVLIGGAGTTEILIICGTAAVPYAFVAFRAIPESLVKPVIVGVIMVSQNLSWLAMVFAGVYFKAPLIVFAFMSVLAVAMQAGLACIFAWSTRSRVDARVPLVNWRDLLRKSIPLIFSGLAVTAFYRGHQLIIFSVDGPEVSANYSAAMRLLDAALVFPATISSVYLPTIARMAGAGKPDAVRREVIGTSIFVLVVAISITITMQFLAPYVSQVLLGDGFKSAETFMRLLFICFPLQCLAFILAATLIGLQRQRALALITGASGVVFLVMSVLLLPQFGAEMAVYLLITNEIIVCGAMIAVIIPALRDARTSLEFQNA